MEAGAERAVGRLDLERVALRVDDVEVDRLQHGAAIALEAPGQVVHPNSEQHACIERAAGRHDSSEEAPVADRAALDVARPEREIGAALHRTDEAGDVGGIMREVAVHLEDKLGIAGERMVEAC